MVEMVVVGELCKDVFIYGDCNRICPEAPVPVFTPYFQHTISSDGMAGNVCSNLKVMGGNYIFICNQNDNIVKTRYIDQKTNQMLLRIDESDSTPRILESQLDYIQHLSKDIECLIISDYNKGFLHEDDIALMSTWYKFVFLDTKKKIGSWANDVTFIKINEVEYNNTSDTIGDVVNIDDKLIVTRGDEGCMYGEITYPVSEKIQTVDVSGAGDTFHSAFAIEYMKSKDIVKSIEYAQACTNIVIKKKGVATL
jgi:D-beta-D-heptose 7-phosphate kinase/D-beta-D-heptose 1-phosphate adenosyltransferase